MQEAQRLFRDYVLYRNQCSSIQSLKDEGTPVRSPGFTDERRELFEEVIEWCRERHIDPRLWVYCLFVSRRWFRPPPIRPMKLARAHFLSTKAIPKYEKFFNSNILDGYTKHIEAERKAPTYDPNVDILPLVEAKKERYLKFHAAESCMAKTPEETFGFHPKSEVCKKCPIARRCYDRLCELVDFDILALRLGALTPEQARIEVQMKRRAQQKKTKTKPEQLEFWKK